MALSGLNWEQIQEIYVYHEMVKQDLVPVANLIKESILNRKNVSIKSRIKNSERLMSKLIRYAKEGKIHEKLTVDNYHNYINDLIGLRIIHVFRSDWEELHKLIMQRYATNIIDRPIVYHTKNEDINKKSSYRNYDFDFKIHPLGYRSINYFLKYKFLNKSYNIDIQLMSIYEDAWNTVFDEIHLRRDLVIPELNSYLNVLKDLSNNADNLAAHIVFTRDNLLSLEGNNNLRKPSTSKNEVNENTIRKLVAKNNLGEALEILSSLNLNNQLLNEITLISLKFEAVENEKNQGTISFENYQIALSNISKSLLTFCQKIF